MASLISAFLVSFLLNFLIIHFRSVHQNHTGDTSNSGIQKFHLNTIPRIGGLSIFMGLCASIFLRLQSVSYDPIAWLLPLLTSIPFAIGLLEDITKKIGVRLRLLAVLIAAFLASHYLDLQIPKMGIPGIDYLLTIPALAIPITLFAITGLTNAYNIVDGLNGLSSMIGMLAASSLAYMGYLLGDGALLFLSLILVAATMGFFIMNYPRGSIFLGDGGAYLIGFWIAILSIWLTSRHAQVSPWFVLLINAYPITETLFTIYRRSIYRKTHAMSADRLHLHSLIYRRILHTNTPKSELDLIYANAKTAPYLWTLNAVALVPALLWWDKTVVLVPSYIFYLLIYLWIYQRIIKFRIPKWFQLD